DDHPAPDVRGGGHRRGAGRDPRLGAGGGAGVRRMSWWCSTSSLPWEWSPRAYRGVWLVMAAIMVAYVRSRRRLTPEERAADDPRRPIAFVLGWLVLWAASDWPIGTLGSGYLASVHMVQYLMYTLMAAPLLVIGISPFTLRRALERAHLTGAVKGLCQPVAAGRFVTRVLVATHAPVTLDPLRASQLGSFFLDALWLLGGIVLWIPICGTFDEVRPSYPVRGVLLFLGAGVVPMIPGAFLTFADNPLYSDRKSTRLNSSHVKISYAVFCLKKKKIHRQRREVWTVRHGGQNVRHREQKCSALRQQVVEVFQRRFGEGDALCHHQ